MVDLTFSFGAMTTRQTVSDTDAARIISALRSFYLRGLPAGTTLTDQQVFDMNAANRIAAFKALVQSEEGEVAARAAKDAIPAVQAT